MHRFIAHFAPCLLLSILASAVLADSPNDWTPLWDGKTLKGWKASENPDSWKITEGKLECNGPRSHLSLQAHAPDSQVFFRNLRVRKLNNQ